MSPLVAMETHEFNTTNADVYIVTRGRYRPSQGWYGNFWGWCNSRGWYGTLEVTM